MQAFIQNTITINKTRLQRGFLLMELLIAMIVISLLTIGWMQWSAHQTQQKQITTTVSDINTIFSAASNCYNNATSGVTTPSSTEPDCTNWSEIGSAVDGELFTKSNYLPTNAIIPISTTSFSLNQSCNNGVTIGGDGCTSDDATFLEVTIDSIPPNLQSAANQVASQLPSAIVTESDEGLTLTAWMPQPASITLPGDTIIKSIKAYASGSTVIKPTDCPTTGDYTAEISATPISCVGVDQLNPYTDPDTQEDSYKSYPLQGCRIQVAESDELNWTVTTELLTPNNTAWVDGSNEDNEQNYISVTTSCHKQEQ